MNSLNKLSLSQLPAQFSYPLLLDHLSSYKKPKDKIRSLVQEGKIVRVKKGLYVLGPEFEKPFSRYVLANLIFGPSYISMHSALSYWGAIPERVELTISMTPKRKKYFLTPIGEFSYIRIPMRRYSAGISLVSVGGNWKAMMATREKALCDLIAQHKGIKKVKDLELLLNGMRIEEEFIKSLDIQNLETVVQAYSIRSISLFLSYARSLGVK